MPSARHPSPEPRAAYHHGDLKRAMVDAALALVTEEQSWGFSLREVARRAGVSHNAPYNHFADKRDLLAAVAVAGFETLRARILAASVEAGPPDAALMAIGVAYVRFGTENPAHYRLMFGTTLKSPEGNLPPTVQSAAEASKAVLKAVILRGAESGIFAGSPADQSALDLAALSAWSLVHGLTMLLVDKLTATIGLQSETTESIAEAVVRTMDHGMRRR
jgi:AcrR family transcriptional regulator